VDEEFVTVAEAATLLRVAPSTVRRCIQDGDVPAYRIGRRHLALKREELATLVTPPGLAKRRAGRWRVIKSGSSPVDARREAARFGGKLFPPSWITINEQRDERTRQLS